mgnify:CR=1 FL=1
MKKECRIIKIVKNEDGCYFHVLGDNMEYYDLENLLINHPELEEYVSQYKYELERELFQCREVSS